MASYSRKQLLVLCGTILLMMAFALVHTSVGYFVAPVTESLGIQRSAYTFYYTVLQLVSILVIPVFSQLISRLGSRNILLAGAVWGALGFLGFSISRTAWMFYIFAAWLGIASAGCTSLIAAVIIYDWFGEKSGTPMGITMAGTGVCGILQGFLMPNLIGTLGWQTVYRLLALCWFIVLVLAAILTAGRPGKRVDAPAAPKEKKKTQVGFSHALLLFLLTILIFSLHGSFLHHMQAHFTQQGVPAALVGIFMSIFNVFVITFKISQGVMFDRFGAVKTTILALGAFAAGLMVALAASPALLFVSLILLAFGMSAETVLTPLLTRNIFGSNNYAVIYGRVSMAYNIGTAFGSPLWGAVYDTTGSYLPALWVTPFILLVDLAIIVCLMKKKSRI